MITFSFEKDGRKVEHSIDNEGLTLQEFFMFWVDFAAGCGYYIDKIEMAEMWNGDLEDFLLDREEEIVVETLKKHYKIGANQEDLNAIALVLKDFMPESDYLKWIEEIAK